MPGKFSSCFDFVPVLEFAITLQRFYKVILMRNECCRMTYLNVNFLQNKITMKRFWRQYYVFDSFYIILLDNIKFNFKKPVYKYLNIILYLYLPPITLVYSTYIKKTHNFILIKFQTKIKPTMFFLPITGITMFLHYLPQSSTIQLCGNTLYFQRHKVRNESFASNESVDPLI